MYQSVVQYLSKKYSKDQRLIKRMQSLVERINAQEEGLSRLSDTQLQEKTPEFKTRLAEGASLDSLLPEAFAVVREASKRVLGMRHFDVQLIGGIVLHRGMIAEMKTGEGKTLVATLPIYLNALLGKGVHLVTVNDYLVQRDATQMGHLYNFLGMSVGCIIQDLTNDQRRAAYHADITYGTNNEFGFDYLRDNMKLSSEEMCQRPFAYAIVDEVDSILIDEARTPLIISGPSEDSSHLYTQVDSIIRLLEPEDYEKEEKHKSIAFTDQGFIKIEALCKERGLIKGEALFQPANVLLVHHLNQALKAQKMYHRDVDYIVRDGQVIIIDEFTGRMMKGRRYSDGLHQALEAKEQVDIEAENQTLASITFQNYFRMYPRLAGMTGTAKTEAAEFESIYRLPVVSIPTHLPIMREDKDDEIFRTFAQKEEAIVKVIADCYARKQPVLVGTASIEKSEVFSKALLRAGIPHNVLNARQHEKEAGIIADAGMPGAVTIATNMAGRGTDIKLGGSIDVQLSRALAGVESEEERARITAEVREKNAMMAVQAREAGGLFVLGTERHESRRIDNQLRGRSGRQGDPGASKFFISLEDDLMRIFGPNIKLMEYSLQKNEQKENEPIIHPWITRAIEKAQQRVEAQNFDTRKHLLKYAEVLNAQRIAVYDMRSDLMGRNDVRDKVNDMVHQIIADWVEMYTNIKTLPDHWNMDLLSEAMARVFNISMPDIPPEEMTPHFLEEVLEEKVRTKLEGLEKDIGGDTMRYIEKAVVFRTLDEVWRQHLNAIEHLRQGIHLQAYGQKDPLNEYKSEAFQMFKAMIAQWREQSLAVLSRLDPTDYKPTEEWLEKDTVDLTSLSYAHPSDEEEVPENEAIPSAAAVARNALCPCGSGKRYKICHGRLA